MNFSPAQLPEIDAIDVVNLDCIYPDRSELYMAEAIDAPHVRVANELTQQIAELWRWLPKGEQSRCHTPPFGLRFYFE